ncbi:MAG: NUDIX hydrolase [Thermoanaerobaculia bacterium]
MKPDEDGPAQRLASRSVYDGKILQLVIEEVRLPNGGEATLEMIRHPGASAVVALTDNLEVLLVRQYRHATGDWLLEVPAGKLDPGEGPQTCARREMEEETGYRAGDLKSLGWIWTTPGFTDEKIWLYLGTGLEKTQQNLQGDEDLRVERLLFSEAVRMAQEGGITDGKSICALLRAHYILDSGERAPRDNG